MIKSKKSKKKILYPNFFKNFKNNLITMLVLVVCFIFITNPSLYAKSCLNAISVWGLNVLPMLLPFFIFTRIIVSLCPPKKNVLDKPFKKAYHTPDGSFLIFFLSVISGYPMGAKLISNVYENKYIDNDDALAMLSFCSISGPMFMIGTVGVSIFGSYKAGLIILIANVLACLINGLIFRKKNKEALIKDNKIDKNIIIEDKFKGDNSVTNKGVEVNNSSNILADSVYDSLNSILLVGAYIVLSFLLIDLLKNIGFISNVSSAICSVLHIKDKQNVVESALSGLIEITRGNIDLATTSLSLGAKTVISSGLIGFGGISVLMQSTAFIKNLNLPFKTVVKQKIMQGILATVCALPFVFIL